MLPFIAPITSLAVRVITSTAGSAGTDNVVYFDIGALGWELLKSGGQFEAGSDETYSLDISGLSLSTDDVVWLRLHKKGIGGWLGTPDGSGGAWKPKSVHLIVNGKEWVKFSVDQWLSRQNAYWKQDVRPSWSKERRLVRTTRLLPNDKLKGRDEAIAIFTTPFKHFGISGWLGTEFSRVCAIGTVIRTPARSTDGLATIDLKVALLNVNGRRYRLDSGHGITGPRFLRVEYPFTDAPETVPSSGQCVEICGRLKWDTDHEGWYEIHPAGRQDVKILGNSACKLESLPQRNTLSLRAALMSEFPGADLSAGLRALDHGLGTAGLSVRELIESAAF